MSENAPAPDSANLQNTRRGSAAQVETFKYDNYIVRAFAIATTFWGLVGTSVGLLA